MRNSKSPGEANERNLILYSFPPPVSCCSPERLTISIKLSRSHQLVKCPIKKSDFSKLPFFLSSIHPPTLTFPLLPSPQIHSMSDSTSSSPPAPTSNLPPAAAQASHAAVKSAISKDVTVLSDPTNFNVKHPLYSPWTLWFDSASKQDKAKSWEEALSKVISFQSVEEFWGYVTLFPIL